MEEYRAQLDKDRDQTLSRGTNHQQGKEKKKKNESGIIGTATMMRVMIPARATAVVGTGQQ